MTAPATTSANSPRVGLVLSGGGARAFAHIGALRVLEERGIHADVIAGTSMGAIVGAMVAAGHGSAEIRSIVDALGWRDVVDVSLQGGLMKGEKLGQFLAAYLPERFEDLDMPLAVTTTDIETGEEIVLQRGPLIPALRASSCYPGAFDPVVIDGRTLADGGIVNNLPVEAVALMHPTVTIASDATPPRRAAYARGSSAKAVDEPFWERMLKTVRLERRNPMLQMLLRSSDIMQTILADIQYSLHPADLRIRYDMPEVRVESFREASRIVRTGELVARRAFASLPEDAPLARLVAAMGDGEPAPPEVDSGP